MSTTSEQCTLEAMQEQIDAIQGRPHARIIGSLGRSVLYNHILGTPLTEYETRGQMFIDPAGPPRDIDVICPPDTPEAHEPFTADDSYLNNPDAAIVVEGNRYFLVSKTKRYSAELHEDTMVPVDGVGAGDLNIITLPIQTHLAIYGLNGQMRRKDRLTRTMLASTLETCNSLTVNPRHYAPFTALADLNRNDWLNRLTELYRDYIPFNLRRNVMPVAKVIRTLAGRK